MNYNESYICSNDVFPEYILHFKEESMNKIFNIPEDKPCIENICDILLYPKVVSSRLIKSEAGYSNEGQKLTGYKLIVELNIELKITYVACESNQSIYAINYNTLKSMFITLPDEIDNKSVYDLFNASRYTITPYIEHNFTKLLNHRSFNLCILLLLYVKFC